MQGSTENALLEKLHRDYISACHILHYHNVLDAFGHLSFRHPLKPDLFVLSRNMAPGTVSSPSDLVEYYIEDARSVDPQAPPGFAERHIHSECYKLYPGIHCVLHHHSEAVIPYTFCGVPFRASCHMAGFLGTKVPVWDIKDAYKPEDKRDLLVRNSHLGASLAASFSDEPSKNSLPDRPVTLMRSHGATVLGETIPEVVMKAYYTQKNALIQTTALTLRAAEEPDTPMRYLGQEEIQDTAEMSKWANQRPWLLWLQEVESCPLYINNA